MRLFTPEKPPKSGVSKKLWDWWIEHTGTPPEYLSANQPGKWQRAAGTPNYLIYDKGTDYAIWNADEVLKQKPDNAAASQVGFTKTFYFEE